MGLFKHGLSKTRIHGLWRKVIDRCTNPNASNYHNYGGRGISICHEWRTDFMNFYSWAIDNGYQEGLSLERIDVNGNYEPSNCKWIELREQCRNKRDTKYAELNGVTKPLIEWAEIYGIPYKTIITRWYRGWRGTELVQPSKKQRRIS
ncbi:hypothetical protein KW850_10290 [Bacillus sp. sid0103]|uniref:hypothetical protein n=1 Tax=Bacillus sp. sid0103 TaxID=2856337 RepID=UPI001C449322|nr:hypothetical protein [Bacillus sp. sid0103]MBV7505644.1 hypothetical protein [Bacillus sp. sid0103]